MQQREEQVQKLQSKWDYNEEGKSKHTRVARVERRGEQMKAEVTGK